MFWQEEEADKPFVVPDDVQDLAFAMEWRTLPVDHAAALVRAIALHLPWFPDEPGAALHIVHGADSGNGWERPEGAHDVLYLSKRTKLLLRLPKKRLEEAAALTGAALEVLGHRLTVGPASPRRLAVATTLYARYVAAPEAEEEAFLARAVAELRRLELRFKKVLCGKAGRLSSPSGEIVTRSLMVADLPPADSIRLQEYGVGAHRQLGCGLFIPHKSLK